MAAGRRRPQYFRELAPVTVQHRGKLAEYPNFSRSPLGACRTQWTSHESETLTKPPPTLTLTPGATFLVAAGRTLPLLYSGFTDLK